MSYLSSAFPAVVNTTDFDLEMYNRICDGITDMTIAMAAVSDSDGNLDFSAPAYAILQTTGVYFSGGDILDGSNNDICLSILFRNASPGVMVLISKHDGGLGAGYYLTQAVDGLDPPYFIFSIWDGADAFQIISNGGHGEDFVRVDVILDRSDESNCKIFVNGVDDTETTIGTLADVGSVSNANNFTVGAKDGGGGFPYMDIADVRVYIAAGATWTAEQVRYHYNNPYDYGADGGSYTAAWSFDDGGDAANADGDGMITDDIAGVNHLDAVGGDTTNYGTHSRVAYGIEFGSEPKITSPETPIGIDYLKILDDPWTFGTLAPAGDCTVSNDATVDVGGTLTLSGDLSVTGVIEVDTITGASFTIAQIAEPDLAPDEHGVMWCSNGTGIGDVGDIMVKIQHGAVVRSTTLVDFA